VNPSQALRLLSNWKMIIETVPQIEQEEGALTMALSQAFLEWEEKSLLLSYHDLLLISAGVGSGLRLDRGFY